jgi:predicted nucleotidyltransferase
MTATTPLEKEIVLKLFKDFKTEYNPSTIAKVLGKTRVGTFKALNSLESDSIVTGRTLGKARFYKINLVDEYARKNVETLLMEEAKKYPRWKDELHELFEFTEIVVLFGSIIRNEEKAHDIDVLIVFDKKNNSKINGFIKEKNQLLIRRLHPIKQTEEDLKKNIQKEDKIILSAIKEGIILQGYDKMIELIKHVTGRQ